MVKPDYTKVEGAFEEGLRQSSIKQLLDIVDLNEAEISGKKTKSRGLSREDRQYLARLKLELKYLKKQGADPYAKLKINKQEVQKWLEDPLKISDQTWLVIKKLGEEVDSLKQKIKKSKPDEDLVEQEREKHINKRFNVNEKWLPLK